MTKTALHKIKNRTNQLITDIRNKRKAAGQVKCFCIGRNKTGTTFLKRAFENLGYPVGNQRKAEILTGKYYFEGNFQPIVAYCESAQVFQDVPFSYPETYKHLDKAYPGSKFISQCGMMLSSGTAPSPDSTPRGLVAMGVSQR